jgi:transcriptional regulator with XRE-family HTH domain
VVTTTTRNELGEFLRSRRERADPHASGVVTDLDRRRVPGLRREELAMLSGVSATYYARLEQGRDRHPSPQIVDALADALRLDAAERAHLHRLAGTTSRRSPGAPEARGVRPGVVHLLGRWSELPAYVVNERRDVLAATPLAGRVNPAWTPGTNLAEFAFLDPRARAVYPEWSLIAGQTVAGLRASAALETAGDEVGRLIDELRQQDGTFAAMWAAQDVYDRTIGTKQIAVQGHGVVTLNFETFLVGGAAGQTLFVYFADPGSPDDEVLTALRGSGA